MPLVGDISGSAGTDSRIGITGSVVFAGADPDYSVAFPDMGNDVAFYVSGSIGGRGSGTDQGVGVFGGDLMVSGVLDVGSGLSGSFVETGLVKTISGDLVMYSASDLVLYSNDANIFWRDSGTSVLGLTNNSSDVIIQSLVADKKLQLATSDNDTVAEVDSSVDGFRINRKLFLGLDSIDEDGTLAAAAAMNIIAATGASAVEGTLADPTAQGQLKVIMGVSVGPAVSVVYTGLSGSVTKTLTNGTGILLVSLNMGSWLWLLIGDVS